MRRTLLAAAAIALIPGAVHAQYWKNSQVLATAGYWSAIKSLPSGQTPNTACELITTGTAGLMQIGTSSGDGRLNLLFFKRSWSIPLSTKTSMSVQIGGWAGWGGENAAEASQFADGHALYMIIPDASVDEFFKELLSGRTMIVTFSGTEPSWTINLSGVDRVSQPFFHCVDEILNRGNGGGGTSPFHNVPQGPSSPNTQPFDQPSTSSLQQTF